MTRDLSRRSLLAGSAGLLAAGALPAAAAPVPGLEILGAPNGSTVMMVDLLESGALAAAAPGATFRLWRTTDDLRAGIVSGKCRLFTSPSHVPANLAVRGMPIRIVAIIGLGHLSVVGSDRSITSFADLRGREVLGFFRNDMPDLVFRAAAKMEGIDPDRDLKLTYVQTSMEAAQMLAAGRVEVAILSEPPATSAITMAATQGRALHRLIDLTRIWERRLGRPRIPMVAVAVHQSLIDDAPELLAALRTALPAARDRVLADPAGAARRAERTMQMRAPVFEKAFPHMHIELVSARAAKPELESFYSALLELDPDSIGGRLPPDDFYLDL
jgi:NitT/TauT family transport system substrate-binding protein